MWMITLSVAVGVTGPKWMKENCWRDLSEVSLNRVFQMVSIIRGVKCLHPMTSVRERQA